jgi:hypothetical protein
MIAIDPTRQIYFLQDGSYAIEGLMGCAYRFIAIWGVERVDVVDKVVKMASVEYLKMCVGTQPRLRKFKSHVAISGFEIIRPALPIHDACAVRAAILELW